MSFIGGDGKLYDTSMFNEPHMDLRDYNSGASVKHGTRYINWYQHQTDKHTIAIKYLHYMHGVQIQMTLLIPDRDRPQREDFIWAVPVERAAWQKWYSLADKFKGVTPTERMRYMHRYDTGKVKTILVLPSGNHSDEDVLAACAWLRMVKEYTCKMYVLRCTDDPPRGARLIERVMGCDPALVEEVAEGEERGTDKDGNTCPTGG